MAIYKPTYCYPYGSNVDFCVDPDTKAIYLQCKLNTSNKKVTGYKLTLTDSSGNEIWTPGYISPIDNINLFDYGDRQFEDHGSGFNGSVLIAPLVQNFSIVRGAQLGKFSPNCLYANIDTSVDYYITTSGQEPEEYTLAQINAIAEVKDWNNTFDNSYNLPIGTRFLVRDNYNSFNFIYKLTSSGLVNTNELTSTPINIYVRYGVNNHNKVFNAGVISGYPDNHEVPDWLLYFDSYSPVESGTFQFKSLPLILSNEYSWKLTLYQGEISLNGASQAANDLVLISDSAAQQTLASGGPWYYLYAGYSDEYNINQYDVYITQGKILGSTGSRLQIYPADAILQKNYVQLGKATIDSNGIVTDWTPSGVRANIEIYDSSYGHIYPQAGKFEEELIENNLDDINACMVYKHSNDPTEVLDSDMVVAATTADINQGDIDNLIFHIFHGGTTTIDDYETQDGDLVLLKDLSGREYLNGVYVVSAGTEGWKRSGSYNEWANFLGKIILVKNGTKNANHNFQSQAQVGGVIGAITGSGVNAIRPSAANYIIIYTSSAYKLVYYDLTSQLWKTQTLGDFNSLLSRVEGSYILYLTEAVNSGAQTTATLPQLYYVPTGAASWSDCVLTRSIKVGDICWATDVYSGKGGFIQFANYADIGYHWYIDSLTAEQMGSQLFFIPEQGIILYPNYENLATKPALTSVDLAGIKALQLNNDYITRYSLNVFDWVAINPTNSTSSLTINGGVETDGLGTNKSGNLKLNIGSTFLGVAKYYAQDASWSNDLAQQYGECQYLCPYDDWIQDNKFSVPKLKAYPLASATSGGVTYYYPNTSSAYAEISLRATPILVLEYVGSGSSYTYYLTAYSYSTVKTKQVVPDPESGELMIDWVIRYNLNRTQYAQVSHKDRVVLVNTKNISIGNNKPLAYDGVNHRFVEATSLSNPVYYFGQYTINTIASPNCTVKFAAWPNASFDSSTNENKNLNNYLIRPKRGALCKDQGLMIVGTYSNPAVQYGITNKIGLLNINNADITYIKPAINIVPDQYMVFTEVDAEPRKIVEFDAVNYGVKFNKTDGNVNLWAGTSFSTQAVLTETTALYWKWTWSTGTPGYTAPNPRVGDKIWQYVSLTGTSHVITEINNLVYSSVENSVAKTPYKYKIMSYFKDSDYNAVTYSGGADIGFAYVYTGTYAYDNMAPSSEGDKAFIVDGSVYVVTIQTDITFPNNKSCQLLRGFYKQGTGKRWEYYRMIIFDHNGVVLQDSGNIYDGDFSQYFWGLQPNVHSAKTYYCLLLIEDEFGQIYTTGAKLIYPSSSTSHPHVIVDNNTIKYNYNLQSIDIDLSTLDSASGYTLYRKEVNAEGGYQLVDQQPAGFVSWRLRDYNITNGRKYQYFISQNDTAYMLQEITLETPSLTAASLPIATPGKCWSITELLPADVPEGMEQSPTIKQKYIVDENRVWLFKYNGEFGSQTQNVAKSEQTTLGKYPRVGHGLKDNQTGSISALLGSEIIPGIANENGSTLSGYQERLRSARYSSTAPHSRTLASSNNAIDMLNAWRDFVKSKNPKLLKDVKGQSWIVQIISNQNTPMMHVPGQPDSISFSWTQIGDPKDLIITGGFERKIIGDY